MPLRSVPSLDAGANKFPSSALFPRLAKSVVIEKKGIRIENRILQILPGWTRRASTQRKANHIQQKAYHRPGKEPHRTWSLIAQYEHLLQDHSAAKYHV